MKENHLAPIAYAFTSNFRQRKESKKMQDLNVSAGEAGDSCDTPDHSYEFWRLGGK